MGLGDVKMILACDCLGKGGGSESIPLNHTINYTVGSTLVRSTVTWSCRLDDTIFRKGFDSGFLETLEEKVYFANGQQRRPFVTYFAPSQVYHVWLPICEFEYYRRSFTYKGPVRGNFSFSR